MHSATPGLVHSKHPQSAQGGDENTRALGSDRPEGIQAPSLSLSFLIFEVGVPIPPNLRGPESFTETRI